MGYFFKVYRCFARKLNGDFVFLGGGGGECVGGGGETERRGIIL